MTSQYARRVSNMNLVYGLALHEFSVAQVDRASIWCFAGHRFESCRGLRFFLCPTLVTCWLFHFHFSNVTHILAVIPRTSGFLQNDISEHCADWKLTSAALWGNNLSVRHGTYQGPSIGGGGGCGTLCDLPVMASIRQLKQFWRNKSLLPLLWKK